MQTSNSTTSSYRFYSPSSLHSRKRSEEEILRIIHEYQTTKNYSLRDGIVLQYVNLVESIARRYATSMEPAEDLAQEGYIGLLSAIEGYDPSKKSEIFDLRHALHHWANQALFARPGQDHQRASMVAGTESKNRKNNGIPHSETEPSPGRARNRN